MRGTSPPLRYARYHRARRGFTLVELLVVVSIIVILMAVLLPTIGMVRATSRASQCMSNLRQIGIGLENYKDEDGHLNVKVTTWQSDIRAHVDKSQKIFFCPDNFGPMATEVAFGVNVRLHRMLLNDTHKIIAMDHGLPIVDPLKPVADREPYELWENALQPRHFSSVNAMYYDGRVVRVDPLSFAPTKCEYLENTWVAKLDEHYLNDDCEWTGPALPTPPEPGTTVAPPSGTTTGTTSGTTSGTTGTTGGTTTGGTTTGSTTTGGTTTGGVSCDQPSTPIIDNGDSGFTNTSAFGLRATPTPPGYETDMHRVKAADSGTATWTFTGLTIGATYDVWVTYPHSTGRATDAPYKIFDGSTEIASTVINQQDAPSGLTTTDDGGTDWTSLGAHTITGTTLVIEVSDSPTNSGAVAADALFIECVGGGGGSGATSGSTSGSTTGSTTGGTTGGGDPCDAVSSPVDLTITSTGNSSVDEGDAPGSAQLTYEVNASGLPTGGQITVDIDITSNHTASASPSSVTLTDGSPSQSVTITFDGNTDDEPDDSITIDLVNAELSVDASVCSSSDVNVGSVATGTILDDDPSPCEAIASSPVQLDVANFGATSVDEGDGPNSASLQFTVTAVGLPTGGEATATISVTSTHTWSANPSTVTLTEGSSSETVTITFDGDTDPGDDDTISVSVTSEQLEIDNVSCEHIGVGSSASGTITDDDSGDCDLAQAIIIDNGDSGFTNTGGFGLRATPTPPGYQTDMHRVKAADSGTATWTFSGLTPGTYDVWVTYPHSTGRATDAPYTVFDSGTQIGSSVINQQNAPSGLTTTDDGGTDWTSLGTHTIATDTLIIEVSDSPTNSGAVAADAMQIACPP